MLILPTGTGDLEPYHLTGDPLIRRAPTVPLTRTAFAAAPVISDPIRERSPWDTRPALDWDATLRFRQTLCDQGVHLAEAMDTAQRGMGPDWATALELIRRTMAAAKAHPMRPRVAGGAGTDHVAPAALTDANAILAAYTTQAEAIEAAGGQLILMASRAFTALGADETVYRQVCRRLIDQAQDPVILHWLGPMFDPMLAGCWGSADPGRATDVVLTLIAENPATVDGIKISLLDRAHEEAFRARLPAGVRLYTGDDFNYAPLIEGDGTHHSHALLGIFAAIAPAASQALEALALQDHATYHALLAPTVPLSREIFAPPTRFYKAGIAVLSWLNGNQTHFIMPAGIPVLQVLRRVAEDAAFPFASFDYADGGRLATRHLLALGARRIAFAGGPQGRPITAERMSGDLDVMARAGLDPLVLQGHSSRAFGHEGAQTLHRDHPGVDAAVCFNDLLALGMLAGFAALGRQVGREFRLVGFDDIEECAMVYPHLSSVRCNIAGFGRAAAETLLGWLEAGKPPVPESRAPVDLVARSSSLGDRTAAG